MDMSGVRVHRNSDKPAALQAHAYAQGSDIHLGPGQEKHLPHEAWHVVQQAQGRVRPTLQMAGATPVNNDAQLEREADLMGARALASSRQAVSGTSASAMGQTSGPRSRLGPRQGGDAVQAIFNADGFRYTEAARYAIPLQGLPIVLHVAKGAAPPEPAAYFQRIGTEERIPPPTREQAAMENEGGRPHPENPETFLIYAPSKKLADAKATEQPNDCGMYANALAFDKKTWANEKTAGEHLTGFITPQQQGPKAQYDPSDKETRDALALDIGDMYRIDWDDVKKKPVGACPFHLATVIAKDGADHVTSEADASRDLAQPLFQMYGTETDTFHMAHSPDFSGEGMNSPFVSKYQNPKNRK